MNRFKISLLVLGALFSLSFAANKVHVNQVGFSANAQKLAVYTGTASSLTLKNSNGSFSQSISATLGNAWEPSGEGAVKSLDFSSVTAPGTYAFYEGSTKVSYDFQIGISYSALLRDALRFYYYHRVGVALTEPHAESFIRQAGHTGNATIYQDDGSTTAGTMPSVRGWYDAGDYGRYIVNSGISTYTLLTLHEKYSDKVPNLNVPAVDDAENLLGEIKWNLDWMLSMQAADGGVYHKMTTQYFSGMEVAPQNDAPLRVMGKTTAATLDFAGVMAVASRVFKTSNPTLSAQYLTAAKSAWNWAKTNPSKYYGNPVIDPTNTGSYEDNDVTDEEFFAAAALATVDNTNLAEYLTVIDAYSPVYWPNSAGWAKVDILGVFEIMDNSGIFEDTRFNKFIDYLNGAVNYQINNNGGINAYNLPFKDFYWGSNSNIANMGISFLYLAEKLPAKSEEYKNYAQSILDYVLGKNPIDQSYITGYGSKSPQNPHDRLTIGAWGGRVFPGQVVGGAVATDCDYNYSHAPATGFIDEMSCAATNEVAINWNAPVAYLLAALTENGADIEPPELPETLLADWEGWGNDLENPGYNATRFGDTYGYVYGVNLTPKNTVLATEPELQYEVIKTDDADHDNVLYIKDGYDTYNAGPEDGIIAAGMGVPYESLAACTAIEYDYKGSAHWFFPNQRTHDGEFIAGTDESCPKNAEDGVCGDWNQPHSKVSYSAEWITKRINLDNAALVPSWGDYPTWINAGDIHKLSWEIRNPTVANSLMIDNVKCIGAELAMPPEPNDGNEPSSSSSSAPDGSSSSSDEDGETEPIISIYTGTGNIGVVASGNKLLFENLPANAKVAVYNTRGQQQGTENLPKGLYLVKINSMMFKVPVR